MAKHCDPKRSSMARSFCIFIAVMTTHLSSCLSASPYCRGEPACCADSNYGPGPLMLAPSNPGFDVRHVNQEAFVYHCVGQFTSFLWLKVVNNIRVPVAEEKGRVQFLNHNQTIRIVKVTQKDAGHYIAVARNQTASVYGRFTLNVKCDISPTIFATKEQPVQHVSLGSPKTLYCALTTGDCLRKDSYVYWVWGNDSSDLPMDNTTLESVDIVCDEGPGKIYGRNCSVLIRQVKEQHFRGQFFCVIIGKENIFQSVRLVPPENIVKSWLPRVIGGIVTTVSLVALAVSLGCLLRRYKNRIAFRLRPLPKRDQFEHDAVIVHGDDHALFVRQRLQPGLQQFGYDVKEEAATPGRPENLERAHAILTSYCVILTFSEQELQDKSTCFLTEVTRLKTHRTVLFVRCQKPQNSRGDAWNDESVKGFKIVEWPGDPLTRTANDNNENVEMESMEIKKFWDQLQKNLPKPAKSAREAVARWQSGRAEDGESGGGSISTGSHDRLLETNYLLGDKRFGVQGKTFQASA